MNFQINGIGEFFQRFHQNGESVEDILSHLNEYEKCKFDLKNDEGVTNAPCFIHDLENLVGVICLNSYDFDTDHIMVCVHELTHLMISISSTNNCEINLGTSECWSYFMGNMIKMILEILNGYKNELNLNKETDVIQKGYYFGQRLC